MRLLLCGGGSGIKTILPNQKFDEIIDHQKKILYIPLAMEKERYPSCLEWITNELKEVRKAGIDMVVTAEEIVEKDLNSYAAIFIGRWKYL